MQVIRVINSRELSYADYLYLPNLYNFLFIILFNILPMPIINPFLLKLYMFSPIIWWFLIASLSYNKRAVSEGFLDIVTKEIN
jgi:hypothetical protein